ncbi:hypothetical protein [Streptomyces hokutonensis]|uniref:hypothetical protein n=1 Tax=Streptomyces hokutonensis TaxID=1306990 RepID=UPI003679A6A4
MSWDVHPLHLPADSTKSSRPSPGPNPKPTSRNPTWGVLSALGYKALDCSTGEPITPQGSSGRHAFQDFRDRVTGAAEQG